MNDKLDVKIGATIAIGSAIIILLIGGIELAWIFAFLSFFGWLGINLYAIKTRTWKGLILFMIPLNVTFNPFFLLLLLKSWTMLKYKNQLEELEQKLEENNKSLNVKS